MQKFHAQALVEREDGPAILTGRSVFRGPGAPAIKPRVSDQLKAQGCTADVADFRDTLAAVKADLFSDISIEELTFTRDEAGEFCQAVRKRLGATRLSRVFLLRALTGIRKNGKKPRPVAEVGVTDASATPSTAS